MSSEGSDQLMLWQGVSPVSLTRSPEPERESKTSDTSGPSSCGSSASSDLLGLSLRTFLASALPQPMKSAATWRRGATPSGRLWWVLAIPGLPTSDDESSSLLDGETSPAPTLPPSTGESDWATPTATPYGSSLNGVLRHGGVTPSGSVEKPRPGAGKPSLQNQARQNWTTPGAMDATYSPPEDGGLRPSREKTGRKTDYLCRQVRWPTARAEESYQGDEAARPGAGKPSLQNQARQWPTATAGDGKSSGSRAGTPRSSEEATAHPGTSLLDAVTGQWATPSSQDAKNDTFPPSQGERKGGTLPSQFIQHGLHRPDSPNGNGKSRGSLNSMWVLQLQGFLSDWLNAWL